MLAKMKQLSEDNDTFAARTHRKSLKIALIRTLAVSGILLLVLLMIIIYYAIVFDRIDKLREVVLTANGDEISDAMMPVNQYDQSLDEQHLRSKILRHRHERALPNMLDAVFLDHEPDFDSLYAKVRNKRTRSELTKLEKEYFRCKKESINSNGCTVAFVKLYNLAKEISDKMDKMKKIFNENEETLQRSMSSSSHESKQTESKKLQSNDKSVQSGEKKENLVSSTTDTSVTSATADEGGSQKNSSTTVDGQHIQFSWIIDGQDDGNQKDSQNVVTTLADTSATTPFTATQSTATESWPKLTTDKPSKISWILDGHLSAEATQADIEKTKNETTFTHTEDESHKISWILDGYENEKEATMDKPVVPAETTENPHKKGTTVAITVQTSSKTHTTKTIALDDNPDKISWIIDGHQEEEDAVQVSKTTKAKFANESTSIVTEKASWILDGNQNDETTLGPNAKATNQEDENPDRISWIIDGQEEYEETDQISKTTMRGLTKEVTPSIMEKVSLITNGNEDDESTSMPTSKSTNQEKDESHRISWIIDGNDDNGTVNFTTMRSTSTSTRDIFEELKEVTEGVEEQEDKLRKLKSDALVEDEVKTTTTPQTRSSPFLVMNRTITLLNSSDFTITFGGNCATTPKTVENHGKAITCDENSLHPLDNPSSLENMLDSFERQQQLKQDSIKLDNQYVSSSTASPYDPKVWEALFRKNSKVQQQQDELIDTFDDADLKKLLKFGTKSNMANKLSQDAQFLQLCEQVAKRLRNKGVGTESKNFTPAPGAQFTSRGPGGFPVTGETMKATAQFVYNPNFGMPTIPICFYITPANFRVANQNPMWTPNYQGMASSFASGPMGFSTPNGVFFVPQNFGPTGNFFGQTSGTGGGGQSNIANVFTKNAAPRKQQQQFFCTYMQNNANANIPSGASGGGLGGGIKTIGFSNGNFKMRTNAQNLSTDIIYASYTNVPDHLGHADHFKCASSDETGCYSGKECIRKSNWCDGYVDCADGSDEAACRCIDRLDSKRICDGYADCPMGEDELGCFGCNDLIYSCYDSPEEYAAFNHSTVSMCYSAIEKCDGIMNCLNGRDELECNIIVNDVRDHMSHAVSSSSGYLFHNYRGEWYPVCNNAQKWAQEACANEADNSGKPVVTYHEITLPGPFIEPTMLGQAQFPQSCQQRNADNDLVDQAAYVICSATECGRVKKKTKATFRRKRSKMLLAQMRKYKYQKQRQVANERIVGGSFSEPTHWPFVVGVYRDGKFHCGGTIYSERWIISAAHCVINYHKYYYEVYAGMLRRYSFSSSTQIRAVSHVVVHQAYERRSMRNDLSLLRMSDPLSFSRWVKPICLPDMGRSTAGDDWIWGPVEETLCTVVGWGAVREKGPGSDHLREVVVPIRKQCKDLEDKQAENVCAGELNGGSDACQGDSGGPLFCRSVNNTDEWYLAGVVSHGNGCARPGEVGAYTRVALYLDWIEMAMKFPSKLQPRLICPGYTCIWGGKRCVPKKRRCDRIVECLGGEDEVGCTYNFITDMVGSTQNISTTTESDYYPEDDTTSLPCKKVEEARKARFEGDENENITLFGDKQADISGAFETIKADEHSMNETSTTDINRTTENIPTESITMETNTTESLTESTLMETSTTVSTTTENSTMEVSPTEWTTPESSTTESPTMKIDTTSTMETTEISTDGTKSTTLPTIDTTQLSTTKINSMETTTETWSSTYKTTVSAKPFHVENLVTTTSTESTLSTTTKSKSRLATTDPTARTAFTTTLKPRKSNSTTIPGKFVCQRILQIVELKNRCDRVLDCEDGTDEEDCSCRDYLKGSLNILICDGKADCDDLTDEENCGNCKTDELLCPLSKICVPLHKRCDGYIDCDFKEDEKDCFALTNGREIVLDADRRPVLHSTGIFSRNTNGKWRVVCSHEIPFSEQIATMASNVCAQLGFKSLKFYNTTDFVTHGHIVPIHPDIQQKMRLHTHFSSISEDNLHFSSLERQFRAHEHAFKARTQFIERVNDECVGLFVECEAKANYVEPIRAISAGELVSPTGTPSTELQPALEVYGKPNVFVTPPSPVVLLKKKDEVLDKLKGVIESRKNLTLLIDNKLHEAVEELHWPWVVDIYVDGKLWCVGALVDKFWVLVHEQCHYGVRFNTNYIAVLLGGGKTKRLRHKSAHEQIRRVDCFEKVPKSDVLLYHLEKPAHFTHHILPTFLADFPQHTTDDSRQCIAILHDDHSGRIKAVSAIEERHDSLCKVSDTSCYRLIEHKPSQQLINELNMSEEDFASLSEEVMLKEAFQETNDTLGSTISRFATCTQFGKKNFSRMALEPVDQGILACRQSDSGWYPMALFDYNNTNCYSFKDSIALRTLEKVHGTIQTLIEQPTCEHSNPPPVCSTYRCTLGDCLDEEKICNGLSDCHDGADEDKQMCIGRKKVCQPSEMKCRSTYKCIPKTKFCDHIADCEDMTDEPTHCSCFTYLKATNPKKICDGIRNCWDKSDESPALCNCTADHFQCGGSSKECVPRDFVCDKEPDCPNGEDEKYCFGIEFPQQHRITGKTGFTKPPQIKHKQLPQYGQVIEQTYGVWHTKCFPRDNPPDVNEVRQICKKLGFNPYKQPSYRIIDDAIQQVVETNEWPDQRGRSFGNDNESPLMQRYRSATKAVVVSKFSPLNLNNKLTLFLKPSRPIAEVARWNATDSEKCYRLEIKCV